LLWLPENKLLLLLLIAIFSEIGSSVFPTRICLWCSKPSTTIRIAFVTVFWSEIHQNSDFWGI